MKLLINIIKKLFHKLCLKNGDEAAIALQSLGGGGARPHWGYKKLTFRKIFLGLFEKKSRKPFHESQNIYVKHCETIGKYS